MIFTNLIIPFNKDGLIDYLSLFKLVDKVLKYSSGIIIVSDLVEGYVLSELEKKSIVKSLINTYPIDKFWISINGNNVKTIIKLIDEYYKLGVNQIIIDLPYLSNITNLDLIRFINLLTINYKINFIINNIDYYKLSVLELKECRNIKGVITNNYLLENEDITLYCKENDFDFDNYQDVINIISTLTNLVDYYTPLIHGDSFDLDYFKLIHRYFYKGNVVSNIKWVLSFNGEIDNIVRLPMSKCDDDYGKVLNKVAKIY